MKAAAGAALLFVGKSTTFPSDDIRALQRDRRVACYGDRFEQGPPQARKIQPPPVFDGEFYLRAALT